MVRARHSSEPKSSVRDYKKNASDVKGSGVRSPQRAKSDAGAKSTRGTGRKLRESGLV